MLNFDRDDGWAPFELVLNVRNAKGEITDKKKSIKTDKPEKLNEFYERNVGKPKKFHSKKKTK
jgi:hypothetical protein